MKAMLLGVLLGACGTAEKNDEATTTEEGQTDNTDTEVSYPEVPFMILLRLLRGIAVHPILCQQRRRL